MINLLKRTLSMKSFLNCSQVLLLLAILLCTSVLEAKKVEFLKPNNKAPQSTLFATNNKKYSFPASGSWNIIIYWSLFCHSCIDEMPVLQRELRKPKFKHLKSFFIALDSIRMKKAHINFLAKRKLHTTVLMEEIASNSYVTADKWGVTTTPSLFIVSPSGKIKYSHEGPADMDAMLMKLENLLAIASKTVSMNSYDK